MNDFVSIGSNEVISKKTKESQEPLVDLRTCGFRIDEKRNEISNKSQYFSMVRQALSYKLLEARKQLPSGIDFYIKEAYRTIYQQKESYDSVLNYFRTNYVDFNEERVIEETNKLCAPIETAPHPTGAAIDLTLIDIISNEELDLGTKYNANPHETDNATFLHAVNISLTAKANRKILTDVLQNVGLVCYPSEWWHWSYGDKYWAVVMNKDFALYSSIKEEDIENGRYLTYQGF